MRQTPIEFIKDFVATREAPDLAEFVQLDGPEYGSIALLVEKLLGGPATVVVSPDRSTTRVQSVDGEVQIAIAKAPSGKPSVDGRLSSDLRDLLLAIRVHEVNSFELAYLPPESRKADLEYFCKSNSVPVQRLHRLIDIWMAK